MGLCPSDSLQTQFNSRNLSYFFFHLKQNKRKYLTVHGSIFFFIRSKVLVKGKWKGSRKTPFPCLGPLPLWSLSPLAKQPNSFRKLATQFIQKAWFICILLGAYVPSVMLITLGLSSQHRSQPTSLSKADLDATCFTSQKENPQFKCPTWLLLPQITLFLWPNFAWGVHYVGIVSPLKPCTSSQKGSDRG